LQPYSKHADVPVYRIDLQYNGAQFHGWQSQPSKRGVQNYLESALALMLKHPVQAIAASRTDTGVHAEHQVAIFRTPVPFDLARWLRSLYGLLPESIGVSSIQEVSRGFHPAHDSTGKAYRYRLWCGPTRSPLVAPYVWQIFADCDIGKLRAAAQGFIGTHDFTSFCAADSSAKSKVRTIVELQVHEQGPLVDIWLSGHGFLKQMIRIMVGTLVDIGVGRMPAAVVKDLLVLGDRRRASRTAPAQGLSLVEVYYDGLPPLAALQARIKEGFAVRLPSASGPNKVS